MIGRRVVLTLMAFAALLYGCTASMNDQAIKPSSDKRMSATDQRLEISLNCGSCTVAPEVVSRIQTSYQRAASQAKVALANDPSAAFRIDEYRDRGALRFVVAAIAGPLAILFHVDDIAGVLAFDGVEMPLRATARLPFNDIETVADEIGRTAFAMVSEFRRAQCLPLRR